MVVGSGVSRAAADHCLATVRVLRMRTRPEGCHLTNYSKENVKAHTRFNSRDSVDKLTMGIRNVQLKLTAYLLPVFILFSHVFLLLY